MGFLILLILLGLPVVEIWLMIRIGQDIGALPTIALILGTAGLGMALFRIQGMATLARVQEHLDRGEAPVGELLSGLGLLAAGLLLFIPGFLTDALGLILFIPPVRRLIVGAGLAWAMSRGTTRIWTVGGRSRHGPRRPGGGPVIDGDFEDVSQRRRGEDMRRIDPGPDDQKG